MSQHMHFLTSVDTDEAAKELQALFGLNITTAELVGAGFSSFVLLVNGALVFRIARHAGVTHTYAREKQLLPLLQTRLPVSLPAPSWYVAASEHFPFGVMGYPFLQGIPLKLEFAPKVDLIRLADDLAEFMLALHAVQLESNLLQTSLYIPQLEADTLPFLKTHLSTKNYECLERRLAIDFSAAPRSLVHGDLWAENLLLDEHLTRLVGVVDFEELSCGDVARDFAPLRYVSHAFLKRVVESYRGKGGNLGGGFEERLNFWSLHRELLGLKYALAYPEAKELEDSLAKVRMVFEHKDTKPDELTVATQLSF